jgi:hypothetical protein
MPAGCHDRDDSALVSLNLHDRPDVVGLKRDGCSGLPDPDQNAVPYGR